MLTQGSRIRSWLPRIPWVISTLLVTLLIASPLYFIYSEISKPTGEIWNTLSEPVEYDGEVLEPAQLGGYLKSTVKDTLIILIGVSISCLIIGVGCAWMVSAWHFKGKKLLTILLSFPLAIPTYVMAVMMKAVLFEPRNSLMLYVKENYGAEAMADASIYWKYALAILVLTASFYPYVFIAARIAFARQSATYLESSRVLGRSMWQTFICVALPLARPAIIAGLMLVVLETLNEYGAMKIIGVTTFTTEIFRYEAEELNTAVRLAGILILIVFVALIAERILRGGKKYHTHRSSAHEFQGPTLQRKGTFIVWVIGLLVLTISLIIPLYKLIQQASLALPETDITPYLALMGSSAWLALKASFFIILVALVITYTYRILPKWWVMLCNKISLLGYAIPGAILGVVLLSVKGTMHQSSYSDFAQYIFHGSAIGLILAYLIRFLTVGYNPLDAGFKQISPRLDEASQSLGRGKLYTLFRIHIPLLRYSFLAGIVVLFVDIMKELPLTLILRPSNFETLATKTYGLFAAEERIPEGCIPALILIITSLLGLILLSTLLNRKSTNRL